MPIWRVHLRNNEVVEIEADSIVSDQNALKLLKDKEHGGSEVVAILPLEAVSAVARKDQLKS
jgi:hypothetical protein